MEHLDDILEGKYYPPLTPAQVERQLRFISRQLDASQEGAKETERGYTDAQYNFEVRKAQLIEELRASDEKRNAQEKEAWVLLECTTEYRALMNAESAVKINRSFIQKLRTQSEIVRSVSVSVRTSMEVT